ncbi:hypothetical protein OG689_44550 [Kitasatospora sp. NBC_00240]|uniref:hypothetical protein n=1 Tax=Kitasatospora sp. NBC_00240 TaxID=2903567 RepID=UPI00225975E3|nr:hypothetical protein [Kitasatospora sp. NBC_00240]MCX5216210.1 hypothetical protein [Kitasatospora sp. NBC_00240]
MHPVATRPQLDITESALRASILRARTGLEPVLGRDPAVVLAPSDPSSVADLMRHRFQLDRSVPLYVHQDTHHPLFHDGAHLRAVRIDVALGRPRAFLASYDSSRNVTFSLFAPCPHCSAPVPTVAVNRLEDLGDWELNARDMVEAPHFRTSPLHWHDCTLARR